MKLSQKQIRFAQMVVKLLQKAWEIELFPVIKEVQRHPSTQEWYFKKRLTKTMNSKHLDSLAIDIDLFDSQGNLRTSKDDYLPLGLYWESIGGRWGGNWDMDDKIAEKENWEVDFRHFEFYREW